jgi:hypothetical protein
LIRAEREGGRDHPGAALAQYLEQIHVRHRVGVAQRLLAVRAELDRDRVELLFREQPLDLGHAGAGYVRGAEQYVLDTVALYPADGWSDMEEVSRGSA